MMVFKKLIKRMNESLIILSCLLSCYLFERKWSNARCLSNKIEQTGDRIRFVPEHTTIHCCVVSPMLVIIMSVVLGYNKNYDLDPKQKMPHLMPYGGRGYEWHVTSPDDFQHGTFQHNYKDTLYTHFVSQIHMVIINRC